MNQQSPRRLLTRKQAACPGMSCRFLRTQRRYPDPESPGPTYVKFRRAVHYAVEDLDEWINSSRTDPSTRPGTFCTTNTEVTGR